MDYSKIVMKMSNKQIQLFLRNCDMEDLCSMMCNISECSQEKILNNCSVRAARFIQIKVEDILGKEKCPNLSEKITKLLTDIANSKTDLPLPKLTASYTIKELINYLDLTHKYTLEKGLCELNEIVQNTDSIVLQQLITNLIRYDNIIEYESFIDIVLERRKQEIQLENQVIKNALMQIFSGENEELKEKLLNIVPFANQDVVF